MTYTQKQATAMTNAILRDVKERTDVLAQIVQQVLGEKTIVCADKFIEVLDKYKNNSRPVSNELLKIYIKHGMLTGSGVGDTEEEKKASLALKFNSESSELNADLLKSEIENLKLSEKKKKAVCMKKAKIAKAREELEQLERSIVEMGV